MPFQKQKFPTVELGYTQNFLKDPVLVSKLVSQAKLEPGSTVLEIGPGKGIITDQLAKAVGEQGRVIALELDASLAKELHNRYQAKAQVTIIQQDALTYPLQQLPQPYQVFANVPFSITARLFEWLFDPLTGPEVAHLIVQQETVTEMSKNHHPQATFKSLLILPWYEIKLMHRFAKTDFSPAPSVNTALYRFSRRSQPLVTVTQSAAWQDFLAYISHDRVGEGAWLKLSTKKQMPSFAAQTKLQLSRGLKSQSLESLVAAFQLLESESANYRRYTLGALEILRREQAKVLAVNLAGGHHASKTRH